MAKHTRRPEDEKTKQRRQKRRKRFVLRWFVALVVVALVVTIARYWDKLSPEEIINGVGDFFAGESDDGFPVNVSGNSISQLETGDNAVLILSDTYLAVYNTGGNEVMRRTHAFADPLLRTAGKYMLIAERGGKRLQLETRAKTVTTVTTQYNILTATVHKNGAVAVITAAEQGYNARLVVYNTSGEVIYERLSSSLLTDVAFSPNGKQLAVAAVTSEKGALNSKIEVLSLSSADSEPLYTYSGTDVLVCRVAYLSNSLITAVGDAAVWMYHPLKDACDVYAITDGELKAFAVGENSVAVVTQPYGSSGDSTLTYVKSNGSAAYTATLKGVCRDVAANKNSYAVLTESHLYRAGTKNITQTQEVPSDGKMVARIGNTVTVLGLQNLTAY